MDDHEVKYIPTIGSNMLPSKWTKQWIKMKNRKSNYEISVFISVLSLIVALCFFALIFAWYWAVPEKVANNEKKINALQEVIESQSIDNLEITFEKKKKSEAICSQHKAPGNCFASMPRWYFDNESKTCKQFQYSGCNGNENNFHTEDSCLSTCGHARVSNIDRNSVKEGNGRIII